MHTVICPRSFQDFPRRITDVPAPALGTPIQNIYTLGSVMLHELVHAAGMIDKGKFSLECINSVLNNNRPCLSLGLVSPP
jgi:hypothetical protein